MSAHRLLLLATIAATLGNALVAGVFFAFSSFVMPALARIQPASGVTAMQSINVAVVRSLFIALFLGTAVISAILALVSIATDGPARWPLAAAGIVAVAGSFGVTMWINVPLNDALSVAPPGAVGTEAIWCDYLRDWGGANLLRTIASLVSSALFLMAALRMMSGARQP